MVSISLQRRPDVSSVPLSLTLLRQSLTQELQTFRQCLKTYRNYTSTGSGRPLVGTMKLHLLEWRRGSSITTINSIGCVNFQDPLASTKIFPSGKLNLGTFGEILWIPLQSWRFKWWRPRLSTRMQRQPHMSFWFNGHMLFLPPSWRLSIDRSQPPGSVIMQLAITVHEHLYLEHLLMALGLAGRCLHPGAPMQCQTWYDRMQLRQGAPFPARNGQSILIFMDRRPTYQHTRAATSLLQTRATLNRRERQTHGQVAHTHGPRQDDSVKTSPCQGVMRPRPWKTQRSSLFIGHRNISDQFHYQPSLRRHAVGLTNKFCKSCDVGDMKDRSSDVDNMMRSTSVRRMHLQRSYTSIAIIEVKEKDGIHVVSGAPAQDDLVHMKFLYAKGFHKAVIVQRDTVLPSVTILYFRNVEPQHEDNDRPKREPTPWPQPQPLQYNITKPYIKGSESARQSDYVLAFDREELHAFFNAPPIALVTDITPYDVPDFICEAIARCKPLDRHDRLVIYTDGSSQSRRRHCSPIWTDLHDVSDSWCFAVFAEQYADDGPGHSPYLEFIGLTCQQILYEPDRPHHAGTDHIGSDAAETEALLWSALWRLAQNHRLPTVFVSDSQLVGGQAIGIDRHDDVDKALLPPQSCVPGAGGNAARGTVESGSHTQPCRGALQRAGRSFCEKRGQAKPVFASAISQSQDLWPHPVNLMDDFVPGWRCAKAMCRGVGNHTATAPFRATDAIGIPYYHDRSWTSQDPYCAQLCYGKCPNLLQRRWRSAWQASLCQSTVQAFASSLLGPSRNPHIAMLLYCWWCLPVSQRGPPRPTRSWTMDQHGATLWLAEW